MESVCFSKRLVSAYKSTLRHNPEEQISTSSPPLEPQVSLHLGNQFQLLIISVSNRCASVVNEHQNQINNKVSRRMQAGVPTRFNFFVPVWKYPI
jgi:hypothetical protein